VDLDQAAEQGSQRERHGALALVVELNECWQLQRLTRTGSPLHHLHTRLEVHLPRPFEGDAAALHVDGGPRCGQQDVVRCGDLHHPAGAAHVHRLVSRDPGRAALALRVHIAAGGMQLDARLSVGLARVGGLAVGVEHQAALDGHGAVALRHMLQVLARHQAQGVARAQHIAGGGEGGNPAWGCKHQVRTAPSGDVACAAACC
jgi:hypothetical protein